MQNYVENMWCFFCFRPEKPFLGKSDQKNQNCQFRNLVMMFTFFVFDHKYLSWADLAQKFKIVQSEISYKD